MNKKEGTFIRNKHFGSVGRCLRLIADAGIAVATAKRLTLRHGGVCGGPRVWNEESVLVLPMMRVLLSGRRVRPECWPRRQPRSSIALCPFWCARGHTNVCNWLLLCVVVPFGATPMEADFDGDLFGRTANADPVCPLTTLRFPPGTLGVVHFFPNAQMFNCVHQRGV